MTTEPNKPAESDGKTPTQPARPMVPSFIPPSVAAKAAIGAASKGKSGPSAATLALVAALVVAGGGLGFAGGRLTAPAAGGGDRGGFGPGAGFPGGGGGGGGQGFPGGPGASGAPGRNGGFGGFNGNIAITGQVTAIADGSITVQTSSGQNVTIGVPSSVTYHAETTAAATDVAIGTKVQLSVSTPNVRPGASGAPGGNPAAGANFTATDILVMGK
jgi:hypothetical protein